MRELIDKLRKQRTLEREEFRSLLMNEDEANDQYLFEQARDIQHQHFGNKIFIRGLIEFSNYCKNDCYYCGIRKSNREVTRYRLTKEEILESCAQGYKLGFRTFVLQGGEDLYFNVDRVVEIIKEVREAYPDCAITMSDGEHPKEVYQAYFDAGANRFLLRHETITAEHYDYLHPHGMSIENRVRCLRDLKDIGFQTGSGIMVGSPKQTIDNLIDDIYFLQDLKPEMIGIGPYLPSKDTPFKDEKTGSTDLTIRLLAIFRLMHPNVLLPATTALATINRQGRERGIRAGANVVMPNLSPLTNRKDYQLYDDKACTGDEAAHCIGCLDNRLHSVDYQIAYERGDFTPLEEV